MILQISSNGSPFCDGQPITADRYAEIAAALAAKPDAPAGCEYRLTESLAWELLALPDAEEGGYTREALEGLANAELEQILHSYGITATMNKANMIRLILAAQEGDAIA